MNVGEIHIWCTEVSFFDVLHESAPLREKFVPEYGFRVSKGIALMLGAIEEKGDSRFLFLLQ